MVYVIKGANCLMSRSTLQGLGCLPKSFPEVGKYDEGIAQVNYVAADPKGNTLRRNPESLPTPLSEPSGFQPEGRDLPIPTQLATLRVPERGKEGVQSQPIPTQSPHSGYPLGEGARVRQSSPSPEEENPEVLRAPEEGRDEDDSDTGEPSSGENPPAKNTRQQEGVCDPESSLPCSCPRRQFREPPETLPMPATASNRGALEDFIKDWYAASAFNVCKRQAWPITAGPPMKIFTKKDAVPTYVTKPSPVPLHFRKEVKAGLDADVAKGILEKVPMGTPDTWCTLELGYESLTIRGEECSQDSMLGTCQPAKIHT